MHGVLRVDENGADHALLRWTQLRSAELTNLDKLVSRFAAMWLRKTRYPDQSAALGAMAPYDASEEVAPPFQTLYFSDDPWACLGQGWPGLGRVQS